MLKTKNTVLEIDNVVKEFPIGKNGKLTACNKVSLCFEKGKTLGIIGESGCGKSTLMLALSLMVKTSSAHMLLPYDICSDSTIDIEREDSYGYEISQTVKLVANIKESTLYPILRKLEQNGYLHTYSQEFQGRNRKYYSITDSGKEQLIFLKKEWNEYYHTIDDIIEGRMIPDGK